MFTYKFIVAAWAPMSRAGKSGLFWHEPDHRPLQQPRRLRRG
jgi:hypothetical protein